MQRLIRSTLSISPLINRGLGQRLVYAQAQTLTEVKRFSDAFNNSTNAEYIENLFDKWYDDPKSVSVQWDAYFNQVVRDNEFDFVQEPRVPPEQLDITLGSSQQQGLRKYLGDCFRVRQLINKYRQRGHEYADIDPLKLPNSISQIGKVRQRSIIDYTSLGFTEADLGFHQQRHHVAYQIVEKWKLGDLVTYLQKVYCGKIGYEYTHLTSVQQRDWIRDRIENYDEFIPTKEQRLLTLERLGRQYAFSTFLDRKFNTSKRFGIEGLDSMASGLLTLVDTAASSKVEQIVFGMAHRGRLETLYSVFQKQAEEIMAEFQDLKGKYSEDQWGNSGDVKYHLGCTNELKYGDHTIRLNILPNPSHLEAVNPLVYGKVRALQDIMADTDSNKSFGVVIHGDAAMSGQGIVYECFQMEDLQHYSSGGTIHVVANNQIGFTTVPKDGRSGLYCTDIAHTIQAPIFHVNADEPDLVDKVFQLAAQFRMKFKTDVVIDIVGYRRFGHNELDQPSFTQPIMYQKIKETVPCFEKYSKKLIDEGIITQDHIDELKKRYTLELEQSFKNSRDMKLNPNEWTPQRWEKLIVPNRWGAIKDTGVPIEELKVLSATINHIDPDFKAHPQIKKFYELRQKAVFEDSGIDFATAEALAFGSLLKEGYGVRLSGQDVERATFSHRHALLHDQENPNKPKFMPLKNLLVDESKRQLTVVNSHLSEFGVLGFEYGYSLASPNSLVMWEAQFGDFANGAQVLIDNYIASAETKWNLQSGVTLLLPNGMDGQGPEHSSGRIERFLQLSDDDPYFYEKDHHLRPKLQIQQTNIQICQCTTPANYFHALRRQLRREFRKPLILMTSKKQLRMTQANSFMKDLDVGTRFYTAYPESFPLEINKPEDIAKVLICSGQVYYDLVKKRTEEKDKSIAIIRIEQLAPFPYVHVHNILKQYQKAKFLWVQEEHENYGPWNFVRTRLNKILHTIHHEQPLAHHSIHYVGRKPSSSPATGFLKQHEKELNRFLQKAFE